MHRSWDEVRADIRWGIGKGSILAVTFGGIVAVQALLDGGQGIRALGTSLGEILGAYTAIAIFGGCVVGLLRPTFVHAWGAGFTGLIVGCLGTFLANYPIAVRHGGWTGDDTFALVVYGPVFGISVGLGWYKMFGKGKAEDPGKVSRQQRRRESRREEGSQK